MPVSEPVQRTSQHLHTSTGLGPDVSALLFFSRKQDLALKLPVSVHVFSFLTKFDFYLFRNGLKLTGQREFDREENKSLTKNLLHFISVVRTTSKNVSDNNSHFKDFSAQ